MSSERSPLTTEHDPPCYHAIQRVDDTTPYLTKATPLPKMQMFSIMYIQLAEPITASVIFPFVVQVVRNTGITGGDESKVGYYAGFIVRHPNVVGFLVCVT